MDFTNKSKEELINELQNLRQEFDLFQKSVNQQFTDIPKDDIVFPLQESESLYHSVLNASPDAIAITDLKGQIHYSSPQSFRMFGYANPEDIINHSLFDFLDKSDHKRAQDNIIAILKGIQKRTHEYLGLRFDGTTFNIEVKGEYIRDAGGNPTGVVYVIRDISDRKLAEEKLRKSEEKYRIMVETINDVVYEIDNEANVKYVSPVIEKIFGYKSEEIIGKNAFDFIYHEDITWIKETLTQIGKSDNPYLDYRIITKSGKECWVRTSHSLIYEHGVSVGFTGTITDITEAKMAREKFEKLSRLYVVISHVNHAIIHYRIKEKLIDEVCRIAVKYGKFQFAWIGLVNQHTKLIQPVVSDGFEDGFLSVFQPISVFGDPRKMGPIGTAICAGKHIVFDDLLTDSRVGIWKEEALKRGYRSSITLPLKEFGNIVGAFTLYSSVPDFFIPEEIELLDAFVGEISFAFEAIETENERKQTEEQLRKLSRAVEQSPVSIVIADLNGNIEYVNPKTVETTGYTSEELIGKNPRVLKSGETDGFEYQVLWENISTGKEWKGTFHNRRKNGELYWESSTINPITDKNGAVTHYLAVKEDITLRKLAQEELLKFRTIADKANYGSAIAAMDGSLLYINKAFTSMHGYTPEELAGKNLAIFHNEEQLLKVFEILNLVKLKGNISAIEVWHTRNDGTVFPTLMNVSIISDNNNIPQYMSATAIDISEIKEQEEKIKIQNERLNAILKAIPDLIFVIDEQGNYLEYYTGKRENLLVNENQIIGSNVKILFDDESSELHLQKIGECIHSGMLITYEYSTQLNNSIDFFEARLAPVGENKVLAFIRDITDRRRNDDAIKKLSMAVEQSPVSIVITDLKANIEYVNPAFEKTTLYTYDEIIGKNVRILKSGKTDKTIYENLWRTIEAGSAWRGEWINQKKNGELFWEHISITPIHNELGIITNYLAVKQDITVNKQAEQEIRDLNTNLELKIEERTSELEMTNQSLLNEIEERNRIEEALVRSEQSYRTVVENVNEVIFRTDTNGLWLFLNKSWVEVTGFSLEESIGQLFLNYVHPDDRSRNLELFEPLIKREKDHCRHEIRYLTKDGGFRWVEVFARLGLDEKGEITGTYGTLLDITERKKAEAALLIKTAELENFFSVSLDFLLIADSTGNFVKTNKAWENTLGYQTYELENRNFLEFVYPDDLQSTHEVMIQLSQQKPVFNFINRFIAKDGSYRVMEWQSVPIGDTIYAAGRDITERKRAEDFENELLQLSPKLTGISQAEIDGALNMALSSIGQFLGADRSYIFEFNADHTLINNTYEWCNEGIHPEIQNLQEVPCEVLPKWMELLKRHENIVIPSVQDLPESWQGEKEILEPQGIKSLIVIPIIAEMNLIGFVGLDSVNRKKEYNTAEINNLKVWSSMLASLINDQRSEQLLEQTRQNYETFFNTIDDFLFVLDQQGNIIHTNNTVNKRLEYTKEELFNYPVLSVHPIDRREEAGRIVGEMLAGITEYCPVPIVTKSGVQIPVETRVKPGYWNGQQVIFGVSKDISQIKLSEQKFASAFHSNSAMMAISDFYNGEYIDVNNALLEILGYSRNELIGKTNQELGLFVDPGFRNLIIHELSQNIPVLKMEVGLRMKDGMVKTGLISCDSIYIGDRRCLLSVTLDISERKKAEEEIKKARQAADASNLAKSEFLSRMSHELRTPMNSILGFAQLLQMGELLPRQRSGVNHILHSGKHLLDLINEVLDISRIEAGRISLSLEPVQLNGIILEMIDSIQPLAKARQLKLELVNSQSNQLFVKSDRQRLKQVLMNLLSNAIKYDKEGGSVTIATQAMPVNLDGIVTIRILITDTGSGISEDDIPKLFTPFERIGAEKTQTEGTGLGLTVVKKLMDAMGGIVGVESVLGEGSTFWIELPLSLSQLESFKNHDGISNPVVALTSNAGTILYIEDNGSNIELVEQILESQRSKIRLISNMNGKHTVQLAKKFKPDLILLDLNLPDIQGDEVILQLQADIKTREIPVVIISADAMPQQLEKLLKAGARNYLTKPLNVQVFLQEVDKWVLN